MKDTEDRRSFRFAQREGVIALLICTLSACVSRPPAPPQPIPAPVPVSPSSAEPIPKSEPRAALGNPAFYEVFGKRYFVLPSAAGFVERGVASWYGPGFHKERTAIGDPYDMYAMTAAHKTLPLPCYARITNLKNGRSVVVRINDRGPFKDGRIVDLSFTAATKLDMIRDGTALVELRVLSPDGEPPPAARSEALFVQAGAFGDAANAERLAARLRSAGHPSAFVVQERSGARDLHRVRIGPIASVQEFDRIVGQLRALGIENARLASAEDAQP